MNTTLQVKSGSYLHFIPYSPSYQKRHFQSSCTNSKYMSQKMFNNHKHSYILRQQASGKAQKGLTPNGYSSQMTWWNCDGSTNLDPQAKKVIKTHQGRLLIVPTRLSRSTLVTANGVMALGSMLGRNAARHCTLLKTGNWKHLFFITDFCLFTYLFF